MEKQTLFFKEHLFVDLFDSNGKKLQTCEDFKVNLLTVSNKFGYIVAGFNNTIKILSASQFATDAPKKDSAKFIKNFESIGTINLQANQSVVNVQLNNAETHLLALICMQVKEKTYEYFLNAYDMQTVSFTNNQTNQTPECTNTINLEKDDSYVTDLCVSPTEPDQIALCKSNGQVLIISKIFDKANTKIVSNSCNAASICWSTTGKNIIAKVDQSLQIFNQTDLSVNKSFQCTVENMRAVNIKCISNKQFLIGYEDTDQQPNLKLNELNTDQSGQKRIVQTDFDGLVYSMSSDKASSFYISEINEWKVILCAYSNMQDIGVMQQNANNEYQIVDIEDYRLTLPLADDNDLFPLGFGINFNTKNDIDFGNYGPQTASPLVMAITDNGCLVTFYAINIEAKNKSICYHAGNLPYTQKAPIAQTPTPSSGGNLFNLSSSSSSQKFSFSQSTSSASFGQSQSGGISSAPASSFGSQSSLFSKQPSFQNQDEVQNQNFQNQNKLAEQKLEEQKLAEQKLAEQKLAEQKIAEQKLAEKKMAEQKLAEQKMQMDKIAAEKAAQQKIAEQNAEKERLLQEQLFKKQQEQKKIITKPLSKPEMSYRDVKDDGLSTRTRIDQFSQELNDFKKSFDKLFNGKDLSKYPLSLSVVKETKKCEEAFKKLNDEMKTLSEKCSNLETDLLSEFHHLEKLKLQVKKLSESKCTQALQADFDPSLENKFEAIKKLYAYMQREMPNLEAYKEAKKQELREKMSQNVPLHEIYETIKAISLNMKYHKGQINKIIEKLKFAKMGRTALKDISMNLPVNRSFSNDQENTPKGKSIKDEDTSFDLANELSRINLRLETSLNMTNLSNLNESKFSKEANEVSARFYSQLYDVLKRRKNIPTQTVNLNKLQMLDIKMEESAPTKVNLNDTSFLNLQTQSPIVSQPISKVQTQQKLSQQQQIPHQPQLQQQTIPPQSKTIQAEPQKMQQQQGMFSQKMNQSQQQVNTLTMPIQQQPIMQKAPQQVQASMANVTPSSMFGKNISKQATSTPTQFGSTQPKADSTQQQQPAAQKSLFQTEVKPVSNSLFNAPAAAAPSKPTGTSLFNAPAPAVAPSKPTGTSLFNAPAPAIAKAPPTILPLNAPAPAAKAPFSFGLNKATSQPEKNNTSLFNTPTKTDQVKKDDKPVEQKSVQPTEPKKPEQTVDKIEKPKPEAVMSIFSTNNILSSNPAPSSQAKPSLFGGATSSQGGSFTFGNTIGQTGNANKPFSFDTKPAEKKEGTPNAEIKPVIKTDSIKSSTPVTDKEKTPTPSLFGSIQAAKPVEKPFEKTEEKPAEKPIEKPATTAPITAAAQEASGLFKPSTTTSNLFGATTAAPAASSPFQFNKGATTQPTGSLFGGAVAAPTAKPFGEKSATATAAAVNPFTQVANASAEANTAAKPTNLFSAIANTAQKTNENEMESGMESGAQSGAGGLQFGSMGFGTAPKPASEQPKSIFGTATMSTPATQPKSPFGQSAVLKNPTFTSQQEAAKPAFGMGATSTNAPSGGGLFSSATVQPAQESAGSNNLFSSFKSTPQKTGFGAPAPAFGAPAPAFGGAAPAFGAPAPAFGSPATAPAPSFGGSATFGSPQQSFGSVATFGGGSTFGSPPAFGAAPAQSSGFGGGAVFGAAASAPTFGQLAQTENKSAFGAAPQGGSTFGAFGQNAQQSQMGFGNLAQQQPQGNLFSSFGGGAQQQQQQPAFPANNASSFTAYRK